MLYVVCNTCVCVVGVMVNEVYVSLACLSTGTYAYVFVYGDACVAVYVECSLALCCSQLLSTMCSL